MDDVTEFAAWVKQSDRELKEWFDLLKDEDARMLQWLVDQSNMNPIDGLDL